MKVFPTIFAWWWQYPDPDPFHWLPDPGGPKVYGSGTLGRTTFFSKPIIRHFLRLDPRISIPIPLTPRFFSCVLAPSSLVRGGTVNPRPTSDMHPPPPPWRAKARRNGRPLRAFWENWNTGYLSLSLQYVVWNSPNSLLCLCVCVSSVGDPGLWFWYCCLLQDFEYFSWKVPVFRTRIH